MTKRKEQFEKEKVLHRWFSESHEIGARTHGYAWMRMNELMITAAVACGVDYAKQPFKTLLTMCALKALNQMAAQPDAPMGGQRAEQEEK